MPTNFTKLKIVFFYLFSTLFFFLMLEITARSVFFVLKLDIKAFQPDSGRYTSSPFTGYALRPNWELNHNTLKESYNSFGFKSPEFNIIKNDSTFRIVTLGGSSVYGYPLENNQTWPHYLKNHLDDNTTHININNFEVINTGVPGYNTYHSVGLLFSKILDLNPDLIILYQLWNDISYFPVLNDSTLYSGKIYESNKSIFHYSYALISLGVLQNVLKRKTTNEKYLPLKKTIDVKNTFGIKQYRRNVEIIAMICEKYKIPLLLCSQMTLYNNENTEEEVAKLSHGKKEYYLNAFDLGNEILRDIAKFNQNTYYFNPSKHIKANLDVLLDHIHLTVRGNDLLGKFMSAFISNEIINGTK